MHQYGVEYVRGVEVEGFLDDEGRVIEDWIEKPHFTGNQRTLRVWLDTNQYHSDMSKTMKGHGEDVYKSFNLILRRKAKDRFVPRTPRSTDGSVPTYRDFRDF